MILRVYDDDDESSANHPRCGIRVVVGDDNGAVEKNGRKMRYPSHKRAKQLNNSTDRDRKDRSGRRLVVVAVAASRLELLERGQPTTSGTQTMATMATMALFDPIGMTTSTTGLSSLLLLRVHFCCCFVVVSQFSHCVPSDLSFMIVAKATKTAPTFARMRERLRHSLSSQSDGQ